MTKTSIVAKLPYRAMNKFYFFILLESESAHHRPGRLSAGYTELLHVGPSYGTSQAAELTLPTREPFRPPSIPHSPHFCTRAATNFRNRALIQNTVLNPPSLLQINQPASRLFVNRESLQRPFFGRRLVLRSR